MYVTSIVRIRGEISLIEDSRPFTLWSEDTGWPPNNKRRPLMCVGVNLPCACAMNAMPSESKLYFCSSDSAAPDVSVRKFGVCPASRKSCAWNQLRMNSGLMSGLSMLS